MKKRLERLFRVAAAALLALSLLTVMGAWALDRLLATEVQIIVPASSMEVELNRSLWLPGEPVAAIYGIPAGEPLRVLFVSDDRILRPEEEPTLALLPVDKQAGENPLQARTVWFLAWRAAAGLLAAAIGLAFLAAWRSRRALTKAPAS